VELGTGLVSIVAPALVVGLLLGGEVSEALTPIVRCFGVALLSLGVACWPRQQPVESDSSAFRAMLIYNALIALYLAWLGASAHVGGLLLWPAVALHAGVALALVRTSRNARALE
jgi:apolipoprotein N-acyltransferase